MKLLLVDDHPLYIEGLRALFAGCDREIELLSAENAAQALMKIDEQPDIDIILTDLQMPEVNGVAFMSLLNERNILTPIIVISGTEDAQEIRHAIDQGAMGFIPKSSSGPEVLVALDQVLQGEFYLPQHINKQLEELASYQDNYKLSDRQLEILSLIRSGLSNKQIAHQLKITEHTVKTHVSNVFQTFGVYNRIACVNKATDLGVLQQVN